MSQLTSDVSSVACALEREYQKLEDVLNAINQADMPETSRELMRLMNKLFRCWTSAFILYHEMLIEEAQKGDEQ